MAGWETKTPQEAEEIRQFNKAITKLLQLWEVDIKTANQQEKDLKAQGKTVIRRGRKPKEV